MLVDRDVVSQQTAEEAVRDEVVAKADVAVAESEIASTKAQLTDAQAQLQYEETLLKHRTQAQTIQLKSFALFPPFPFSALSGWCLINARDTDQDAGGGSFISREPFSRADTRRMEIHFCINPCRGEPPASRDEHLFTDEVMLYPEAHPSQTLLPSKLGMRAAPATARLKGVVLMRLCWRWPRPSQPRLR